MMVLLPMHSDTEKGLMTAPADTGAGASSVTKLNRTSKLYLSVWLPFLLHAILWILSLLRSSR